MQAIQRGMRALERIAIVMEAQEERTLAMGATTPQEIEALAPAIKAVRQGMADLEKAQAEQVVWDKPIDELNLSVRPYNVLRREGINTIGQLLTLYREQGVDGLYDMRNMGSKACTEVLAEIQRLEGEIDGGG